MMPSPNDAKLDVSAVLEPDADNDGFGDETQDCDAGDATLHDDCVPPETTITVQPKKKTRKKRATLEFAASEAAASFECSLDGTPFAACSSPQKLKVKRGRHHFEVRARDAAGNVDGSPAGADWRIKKKKRR
jgi:hypothetical protein